jgi:hypothetical protein
MTRDPQERKLTGLVTLCGLLYITLYALESPVRYVLSLAGADTAILARDALIDLPLVIIFALNLRAGRVHAAFVVFGALMLFHAMVLVGTVGSPVGAAYGLKLMVNVLFGLLSASIFLSPNRQVARILLLLWCATIVGVVLDKFVMTFPWVGMKAAIGDLSVDVSRDWQIADPMQRRVAGFTRSSINVAALLPVLSIVLICRRRSIAVRCLIALGALGGVFLTTQKGALIAAAPVFALLCVPWRRQATYLRLACLVFLLTATALPFVTAGLDMPRTGGEFSLQSFADRVTETWPQAWQWIADHQVFVFGVGLGGIGGAQRIYAPDAFNPADNVFLFMWAYFGSFAVLYLLATLLLIFRPLRGDANRAIPALATLAFFLGYGCVVSLLEDQMAALFIGASLGVLLLQTSPMAIWDSTRTLLWPARLSGMGTPGPVLARLHDEHPGAMT